MASDGIYVYVFVMLYCIWYIGIARTWQTVRSRWITIPPAVSGAMELYAPEL